MYLQILEQECDCSWKEYTCFGLVEIPRLQNGAANGDLSLQVFLQD